MPVSNQINRGVTSPAEIQLIFSTSSATKHSEEDFSALLSPDEQTRAAGFKFATHRTSFIVTRGLLRVVLGNFMKVAPAAIDFRYGPNGKPAVGGDSRVHFNVSHSGQMVLYGLRLDHEIGVDLERIRPLDGMEGVAKQFFSPGEYRDLVRLPEDRRTEAFFDCWTRKEAFAKFLGTGLCVPVYPLQARLEPRSPAKLVHTDGGRRSQWFLRHVALSNIHSAAVASEGRFDRFRVWKLERPDDGACLFKNDPGPAVQSICAAAPGPDSIGGGLTK